ncbi:MAG TPA: GIY-YIG nuclease family protein [Candidatus Gracilibacteria bacterium]
MENLPGYVYIMGNNAVSTLYVGSTSDLQRRVWEHKEKLLPNSFTGKYNLTKLLYYETC